MENKEEILKHLCSEDPDLLREATENIRTEGDISIIPALFDLLASGKDHHTTTEIINLLADIKDNSFKTVLMDRIKSTSQPALKSLLLRLCWESSLDFSEYASDFTDILLNDEFIVAMEAATTIENLQHLSSETQTQLLQQLKQAPATDEKQFLIDNLIYLLSRQEEATE